MHLPAQDHLDKFFASLLETSKGNSLTLSQFGTRPSNLPVALFVRRIAEGLEFQEEEIAMGLIIARRAVERGLKITRKCAYRLVAVSILIAEKMYQEEHNSLEVYSLLSGIPIQQLATMEANLLFFLNFDISISEEELGKFIKEELNCNSDSSVEQ